MGDVLTDAGQRLRDAGVASAQDASVTPGGLVRTITADTDMARLQSGIVELGQDPVKLADGPIVVTDLVSGDALDYWVAANGACNPRAGATFESGADMVAVGIRFAIRRGQSLCVGSNGFPGRGGVLWTGFTPYE